MTSTPPPTPPEGSKIWISKDDFMIQCKAIFQHVFDIMDESFRRGKPDLAPGVESVLESIYEILSSDKVIKYRVDEYMEIEDFPTLHGYEFVASLVVKDNKPIQGVVTSNSALATPAGEEHQRFNELNRRILVEEFGLSMEDLDSMIGLNDEDIVETYFGKALEAQIDNEVMEFRAQMDETFDRLLGGGDL